jgi:hypothetical protein
MLMRQHHVGDLVVIERQGEKRCWTPSPSCKTMVSAECLLLMARGACRVYSPRTM